MSDYPNWVKFESLFFDEVSLTHCSKHRVRPLYYRKEKWQIDIANCSDCQRLQNPEPVNSSDSTDLVGW